MTNDAKTESKEKMPSFKQYDPSKSKEHNDKVKFDAVKKSIIDNINKNITALKDGCSVSGPQNIFKEEGDRVIVRLRHGSRVVMSYETTSSENKIALLEKFVVIINSGNRDNEIKKYITSIKKKAKNKAIVKKNDTESE